MNSKLILGILFCFLVFISALFNVVSEENSKVDENYVVECIGGINYIVFRRINNRIDAITVKYDSTGEISKCE